MLEKKKPACDVCIEQKFVFLNYIRLTLIQLLCFNLSFFGKCITCTFFILKCLGRVLPASRWEVWGLDYFLRAAILINHQINLFGINCPIPTSSQNLRDYVDSDESFITHVQILLKFWWRKRSAFFGGTPSSAEGTAWLKKTNRFVFTNPGNELISSFISLLFQLLLALLSWELKPIWAGGKYLLWPVVLEKLGLSWALKIKLLQKFCQKQKDKKKKPFLQDGCLIIRQNDWSLN